MNAPDARPQPARVDYAPPPRPWRRGRVVRRAGITAALLLLGIIAYAWGPTLAHRASLWNLQRKCLNASAPADRVVWEEDPKAAARLLITDRQYVTAVPEPHYLPGGMPAPFAAWFSADWDRLYAALSPPGRKPNPTIFMGPRRAAGGGERRLVVVEAPRFEVPLAIVEYTFHAAIIDPRNPLSGPRLLDNGLSIFDSGMLRRDQAGTLRFFAGQPDPADPSHFTVQYEIDGAPGTIDGWLKGDDTVRMEVRDGPAK